MPIFEFKCNECGESKDKLVKRVEVEEGINFSCAVEVNAECSGEMTINDVPTAAALRFKGQWFGTTGGY